MHLSSRFAPLLLANSIERARQELLASGADLIDLADSNPTHWGLGSQDALDALAAACVDAADRYTPDPHGLTTAREALARRFGGGADDYYLSASTSEAYGWLLELLCDPGDAIAVPTPGYPLLDSLCRLHDVRQVPYAIEYSHPSGWHLDLDSAAAAIAHEKVRAIVLVSPGNPTGSYVSAAELDAVAALCSAHDVALIADEVFHPFALDAGPDAGLGAGLGAGAASSGTADFASTADFAGSPDGQQDIAHRNAVLQDNFVLINRQSPGERDARRQDARTRIAGETRCLTISLDGASKLLGLPQAKIGWLRVSGLGGPDRAEFDERLEEVADTYLSVSGPASAALPAMLESASATVASIRERCTVNLAAAHEAFDGAESPYRVLRCDGGWTALVDVPRPLDDESLAIALLRDAHVRVFPGYFYDLPASGTLALSLLLDPARFREGCSRIRGLIDGLIG